MTRLNPMLLRPGQTSRPGSVANVRLTVLAEGPAHGVRLAVALDGPARAEPLPSQSGWWRLKQCASSCARVKSNSGCTPPREWHADRRRSQTLAWPSVLVLFAESNMTPSVSASSRSSGEDRACTRMTPSGAAMRSERAHHRVEIGQAHLVLTRQIDLILTYVQLDAGGGVDRLQRDFRAVDGLLQLDRRRSVMRSISRSTLRRGGSTLTGAGGVDPPPPHATTKQAEAAPTANNRLVNGLSERLIV